MEIPNPGITASGYGPSETAIKRNVITQRINLLEFTSTGGQVIECIQMSQILFLKAGGTANMGRNCDRVLKWLISLVTVGGWSWWCSCSLDPVDRCSSRKVFGLEMAPKHSSVKNVTTGHVVTKLLYVGHLQNVVYLLNSH